MHLKYGVQRIMAVLFCALLTLCSCDSTSAPERQVRNVREQYEAMQSVTATAELTADYGDRVYCYQAELAGNAASGSMTVLTPENIAGTVLKWSDGETRLEYDGILLETGPLTASGLSPADAFPAVLTALTSGELKECSLSKEGILSAVFQSPSDPSVTVNCTLDEQMVLLQAELAENGTRVLTMAFSDWNLFTI